LEVLCPHLPDGLCRIVHKMLAKKPEERYQRAIDLLKELKTLKIEGLDQDWAAELPGFNSADLALSTAGRLEATQQLDRLLRSSLDGRPRRWATGSRAAAIAGLVLAGLIGGGALAWFTRPPPLLATSREGGLKTKRFPTVKLQYEFAQLTTQDKEDAWRAVEEYFPPVVNGKRVAENQRYARLAKRGLANFCVSNQRLSEALKLYEQLANVEDAETDLQLSGIAGEAVVYHRHMQTEQDRDVLKGLDDLVVYGLIHLRPYEAELDQRISSFLAKEIRAIFDEYQRREED
jgi:serine/threonine-protein kinase